MKNNNKELSILDNLSLAVINKDNELKKQNEWLKAYEITEEEILKEQNEQNEIMSNDLLKGIRSDSNIKYKITIAQSNADNKIMSILIGTVNYRMNKKESNKLNTYLAEEYSNWGFVKSVGSGIQIIAYKNNLIYNRLYFNLEHYIINQLHHAYCLLINYHNEQEISIVIKRIHL